MAPQRVLDMSKRLQSPDNKQTLSNVAALDCHD